MTETSFNPNRFLIFTSPFSRAFETALRAGAHLDVTFKDPRFIKAPELRERYFGGHDQQHTTHYQDVWADDAKSTASKPIGDPERNLPLGESVDEVADRLKHLISKLESEYKGYDILLVSHGDALSILAAVLLETDLRKHREHGLGNCGVLKVPANVVASQ